ncbi:MAG: response regulator [Planctomycetes bacterium]|nr:response regulator [Planctomycetota bacterium]
MLVDAWAVLVAGEGQEALELARRERPDLVLLDLSMPVLNGWEVARQLKSDPATAGIPLVACTAHAMAGDRERALATGFDGYLAKPYRPHELVACVESFLGPAAPAGGGDDEWAVDESRLHDSREGEAP